MFGLFAAAEEDDKFSKMAVELQLQIYILAAVSGAIMTLFIFFLAAICGNISKLKRQQRELERYMKRQSA